MSDTPDSWSHWVDHGVTPPQRLPEQPAGIAAYLAEVLGHPVYERWTAAAMSGVNETTYPGEK